MNIFAKKPTTKEQFREGKREMANATRGLERQIGLLQSQEKKTISDIKRAAKTGNDSAMKMLARQLIRIRQNICKLQSGQAQIRGIAVHTQAMHANTSLASGMKGANMAMSSINKQMAHSKQIKIMQEFQKHSSQLNMMSEMMSETIDDVLDDDETEEESEDLTNQVLDEIGIDVASQLSSAPKGKLAGKKLNEGSSSQMDELEKRLSSLKS